MTKSSTILRAVTANDLRGGHVVFLRRDGSWSDLIDEAALAAGAAAGETLIDRAGRAVRAGLVVDPYLIDVSKDGCRVRAAHIREHLRTLGPSVRRDLGKQAGAGRSGRLKEIEVHVPL